MSDMQPDIQYDPEQGDYICSIRLSVENRLELMLRLQAYRAILDELFPKYLEYLLEQGTMSDSRVADAAICLRKRRHKLKLTQEEAAEKAGVRQQQYKKFESGERNILTAPYFIACKVLNALKIDFEDFYQDYAGENTK